MHTQDAKRLRAIPDTAAQSTVLKTESLGIAPTPADSLGDVVAAGVTQVNASINIKLHRLIRARFCWSHTYRRLAGLSISPRVKLPVSIQWGFAFYLPESAHLRRRASGPTVQVLEPYSYPSMVGL